MPKLRDETYAARRQHIVDAARTCFARNGFDATSMADLQRAAGVSTGALYVYFPRKSDLVDAVIDGSIAFFATICAETASGPLPLRDALARLLARIDQDATGPAAGIGFQLWAESVRDKHLARRLRRAARSTSADFTRLVERAVAAGELPPGTDTAEAGRAIYRAAFGFYAHRIVAGGDRPRAVADSIVRALRAEPAATIAA